jgi:hypothetical protein
LASTLAIGAGATAGFTLALAIALSAPPARAANPAVDVAALQAKVAELEKRIPPPELGQQMLELQIRHDRLWWAGKAGTWTLAYSMVSVVGEALRGIEQTNGDAPELQPDKLSEVMPAIMDPAIRNVQAALAMRVSKWDKAEAERVVAILERAAREIASGGKRD